MHSKPFIVPLRQLSSQLSEAVFNGYVHIGIRTSPAFHTDLATRQGHSDLPRLERRSPTQPVRRVALTGSKHQEEPSFYTSVLRGRLLRQDVSWRRSASCFRLGIPNFFANINLLYFNRIHRQNFRNIKYGVAAVLPYRDTASGPWG
jgi:hypothetical protein